MAKANRKTSVKLKKSKTIYNVVAFFMVVFFSRHLDCTRDWVQSSGHSKPVIVVLPLRQRPQIGDGGERICRLHLTPSLSSSEKQTSSLCFLLLNLA